MEPEKQKRRRNPLSPEEVANIILHKKGRELRALEKFKATAGYKLQNIFNVACFCLYLELIFCYFGPCIYQTHFTSMAQARFGEEINSARKPIIKDITIQCIVGHQFNFVVEDYIQVPSRGTSFDTGSDFFLRKNLKVIPEGSERGYRVFASSPALFLAVFLVVISLGAYSYNLNENAYSLRSLTVLNSLVVLAIIFL